MRPVIFLLLLLAFCSCKESTHEKEKRLKKEWHGREIAFPANILCVAGGDTVIYKIPYSEYLVLTYVDSVRCPDFKRQLPTWKRLIAKADSLTKGKVSFLFFLQPDDIEEMQYVFHEENFIHPVCYDFGGKLHALNKFPNVTGFCSFLLDVNRQILAIGNPTHSIEVEKEYARIITDGGSVRQLESKTTKVTYESEIFNMGDFDWTNSYHINISLRNSGTQPLVIEDVITSCSCIYTEYSQEPVAPGKKWNLRVSYKADRPEFFNKDIMVYCNSEISPLNFTVRGNAK